MLELKLCYGEPVQSKGLRKNYSKIKFHQAIVG